METTQSLGIRDVRAEYEVANDLGLAVFRQATRRVPNRAIEPRAKCRQKPHFGSAVLNGRRTTAPDENSVARNVAYEYTTD